MEQLEIIREEYKAGRYTGLLADLRVFISRERETIHKEASRMFAVSTCSRSFREFLKTAAKFCIIRRGGINIAKENRDQIEEIMAEKWIRNESHPCKLSFEDVAIDWAKKHGPGWRDNRLLTYIYLFEREVDTFLALLDDKAE